MNFTTINSLRRKYKNTVILDKSGIYKLNKKLKNLRVHDIDMYNKSYASYKGYFIMCNTSVRYKYLSD